MKNHQPSTKQEAKKPVDELRYRVAGELNLYQNLANNTSLADIKAAQIINLVIDDILGALPKENYIIKPSGNSRLDQQVHSEIEGYNQALQQIKQLLEEYKNAQ